MRYSGTWSKAVVPVICVAAIWISTSASEKASGAQKAEKARSATVAKQLKPQTTCPVMGKPIDNKLFIDYQGKRIYVCCEGCIAKLKKDPEKYIKKLGAMGQAAEALATAEPDVGSPPVVDTSRDASRPSMLGAVPYAVDTTGYWTCPITHPEIHLSQAGLCPACGVEMVFKKNAPDTTSVKSADSTAVKK